MGIDTAFFIIEKIIDKSVVLQITGVSREKAPLFPYFLVAHSLSSSKQHGEIGFAFGRQMPVTAPVTVCVATPSRLDLAAAR